MSPEDAIPVAISVLVGSVWAATAMCGHRLLKAFNARFPEEAFRWGFLGPEQRPDKALFFLRRANVPMLQKDAEVWRLRQRLVLLLKLSVLVPAVVVGIMAAFAFVMVWHTRR